MIRYSKSAPLEFERKATPEFPFFAATLICPYSHPREAPIAIDLRQLGATAVENATVDVCLDVVDQLERSIHELREPFVIDATGSAELTYRRGERALAFFQQHTLDSMLLISTRGCLPDRGDGILTISTWPVLFGEIEGLAREASLREIRWGLAVPIIFPITTNLGTLERLADLAKHHGASHLIAIPVDLDPPAKTALAKAYEADFDEETYQALFHSELEPLVVATERHVAALATERSLSDCISIGSRDPKSNWKASTALTSCGTRMIRMGRDVELGWEMVRSASIVARLTKSLSVIRSAASLTIVEALNPVAAKALDEWMERGRSIFFDEIDSAWRLRRDHGVGTSFGVRKP